MLWSVIPAAADPISGEFQLLHQNIYISDTKSYHGQFDLRSTLPMGEDFSLSKVTITFQFQDDQEWQSKAGKNNLSATGIVKRHRGKGNVPTGQTDHYYKATKVIVMTNQEEVAELKIGNNKYFSTTIRRREVTEENLGQKAFILGTYADKGDDGRIRKHVRVTDKVLETRKDGFDGLFAVRRKSLDLAAVQDLARTGIIDFELGGQGDYIFVGATLEYEGFATGYFAEEDPTDSVMNRPLWIGLVSFPLGGMLWWHKLRAVPKPQRRRHTAKKTLKSLSLQQ